MHQNISCGYSLELPQWAPTGYVWCRNEDNFCNHRGNYNEYPQNMFSCKNEDNFLQSQRQFQWVPTGYVLVQKWRQFLQSPRQFQWVPTGYVLVQKWGQFFAITKTISVSTHRICFGAQMRTIFAITEAIPVSTHRICFSAKMFWHKNNNNYPLNISWYMFVCAEVLGTSQPNGVMPSAVSLPNHTFTRQAQSSKRLTSTVHILLPETDNCPSWISGRERMTTENFSWSNFHQRMLPTWHGSNLQPPDHQLDVYPTEPQGPPANPRKSKTDQLDMNLTVLTGPQNSNSK